MTVYNVSILINIVTGSARIRAGGIGRQLRRWKEHYNAKVARGLVTPRSLVWYIHVHSLLLLILAMVMIGSFFEVICPFALFWYFQSLFYLKQDTQPVFSLLVFSLCFSCVVRIRREIFFIRTNSIRENENDFSFVWGDSKYALFSLCLFLSRICSYTFQLQTIVRSFSQYIRRAFVLEYPFQVSGLVAPTRR